MTRTHRGFTLIELVIIIAIIIIVAVVVIPRFNRLSYNAQKSATETIAGALSAANANNFATRTISPTLGNPVKNCTDVSHSLHGGLPEGYSIVPLEVNENTTVNCTLTGPRSTKALFTATGTH